MVLGRGNAGRVLFESGCLAHLTLEQRACDTIVQHKVLLRKAAPKNGKQTGSNVCRCGMGGGAHLHCPECLEVTLAPVI